MNLEPRKFLVCAGKGMAEKRFVSRTLPIPFIISPGFDEVKVANEGTVGIGTPIPSKNLYFITKIRSSSCAELLQDFFFLQAFELPIQYSIFSTERGVSKVINQGYSNSLPLGGIDIVGRFMRTSEVLDVVDDGDVERAARAASDLLSEAEVLFRYLKQVSAWTGIGVRLDLLVPLHVLYLYLVV
ncbi:hypothetical protein Nepgr_004566 [Nepenthes gracilis]|uniref:Uncharacterized protein n=1 Tax=Nepenthes gracilis TaxID=150966 RepID=A0AAD3XFD7_NEPGR|nr:hypothetical protein Nepgr_004566 [Nepenthes gracilis]